MAGHLYQGKLYVSSNGANPGTDTGKVVAVDPGTGAVQEALTFPPTADFTTDWVRLIDVNPQDGTIYVMRHVKRDGGGGALGLGDTRCEAYDQEGRQVAAFVRMHVYPYLNMCAWTPAGMFTAELVPDARFTLPAEELADFTADPNRHLVGNINQVAMDAEFNVYAAGSTSRNVSVFSPTGEARARIGALLAAAVAAGPRGELWFLSPQNGLAQGLANTRSSEAVGRLREPATAQPGTPPEKVSDSYADLADVRGLVVTAEGWYYRLVRRNEQGKVASNWEMRMGTTEGRPQSQHAVGQFTAQDLVDPGQMCLLETQPGQRVLVIPDAAENRLLSVPLFSGSGDLFPRPLALTHGDGAALALVRPRAVAVDEQGNLLVACAQAVYRFRAEGGKYTWDPQASAIYAEATMDLTGIAVHGGRVFVSDAQQHRVLRLDAAGKIAEQYGVTGEAGLAVDHLNRPGSLAVIGDFLYIADTGNLRVVRVKVG